MTHFNTSTPSEITLLIQVFCTVSKHMHWSFQWF